MMEKEMNRFTMLATAGSMALLLTACGENAPKKPDATTTETTQTTTPQPAANAESATITTEQAPNEAEAAGATSQE